MSVEDQQVNLCSLAYYKTDLGEKLNIGAHGIVDYTSHEHSKLLRTLGTSTVISLSPSYTVQHVKCMTIHYLWL